MCDIGDLLRILESQPRSQVTNIDVGSRLKTWALKLQLEGIETVKNGLDGAYWLYSRNVNPQLCLDALAADLNSVVRSD